MRGLVVGCGSIGKRHLKNLRLLGVDELAAVESDDARRTAAASELGIAVFPDIANGLNWSPDFAVVASPTFLHIEHAAEIASRGFAVFIEKPLSHTADGIFELSRSVQGQGLVSMVGCNMRFHPGPRTVKEVLDQERIGRVICAHIYAGSYLPAWRPGTDYRANYAARMKTGGGCILDCIHEIDLARWYVGEVQEVFCVAGHLSSLEIETEDVAALILRHASGAISEVHLDYVQRTYERGCKIAGERGSVFWDYREKKVRHYDAISDNWATFEQPRDWQLNDMYVDEMRHFLDCVADRKETVMPVATAAQVTAVALAAKRSALEKAAVTLPWSST